MIKTIPLVGIALIIIISGCAEQPLTEITWHDNLDEAKAEQKDMLIKFWREGCKWCQKMDDSTFTDTDVIQLNRRMAFVKINGKEDTLLAKRYGIAAYPTTVITDKDGNERFRIIGYLEPVEFLNTVELGFQDRETLNDYLRRAEASPDSVMLLFNIGDKYEGRSEFEKAKKYYEMVIEKDPGNSEGFTDDALHNCGWLEFRDKNFQGAIDREEEILKKFPDSDMVENARVYIPYYYAKWVAHEEEQGDRRKAGGLKKKAISHYEEYLKLYPEGEDAEWVNEQLGKLKEN
jgi:thioredoxin-related protein